MSTTDLKKILGANLRRLRGARTQSEVAAALGIKQQQYERWESGETMPHGASLSKLANIFQKTTDYLLREQLADSENTSGSSSMVLNDSNVGRHIPIVEIQARMIPVVTWGAAGLRYISFDDFRAFIAEQIATISVDRDAFAVIIEGDSMMPDYPPGVRAIVEPNQQVRSNDLVLVRLKDDRQMFKRFQWIEHGKRFRLVSINPVYAPIEASMDDVVFLAPVKQTVRIERV